jgi:O-methyltransferase
VRGAARVRQLLRNRPEPGPAPAAATTVVDGLDDRERQLVERCQPYTMASPERIIATADAVTHVVDRGVEGALLECGVWRGGSVLAMILALQQLGVDDRDLYVCDTFSGMTQPSAEDTSAYDVPALETFEQAAAQGERAWDAVFGSDAFGREQVEDLLRSTGYPVDRIHFVVGPVEDTLPQQAPDRIAVLRLDTDWYASTKHEMEHLYPRLSPGGVLLIDDYGHWEGARKAVEEYFAEHGGRPLLARTDYTGRLGIKQ